MTEPDLPPADDPASRAWLRTLSHGLETDLGTDLADETESDPDPDPEPEPESDPARDPESDGAPHPGSPGALAFLRATFAYHGAVPAPYFVPLLSEHRRTHAERVVTALLAQARRDTVRVLDVPVHYEWPGDGEPAGRLTVGHETIWGIDPVDIAVGAAEGVRCLLADRDRVVWPLCPTHRTGPHAARTPTGAAWICAVTAHVVAPLPT